MKITLTEPVLRFSEEAATPRVSIYYPTHRNGPETRQDPIRMKNLLRMAADRLKDLGQENKTEEILQPAWDLLPDIDFWVHQQEGLALFASPSGFRYFHLPYTVPELAVAASDFYLKPLLPLFSRGEQFYILALGKNNLRLYEANRYSIHRVETPDLPESIFEALQFDDPEQTLQQHSFGPTIGAKGGPPNHGATTFHGQGAEKDTRNEELVRYFRLISRGLQRYLNGSQLPLVLAGVDHYFSAFREICNYPHLVKEAVSSGGVETMPDKDLHEKAWPIVKPYLNQAQKKVLERFERIAYSNGNGAKNAARALESAVVAAFEGRIDALVLPRDQEIWGEFDESTEEVKLESSDPARKRELLDFAAMQTIRHGGELFLIPRERMPANAEVAALLRYSGGLVERE